MKDNDDIADLEDNMIENEMSKFKTAEKEEHKLRQYNSNRGYDSREEGAAEKANFEFIYGGRQIASKVLTFGAGGDNQAHVVRPRTAQVKQQRQSSNPSDDNSMKRVNSFLKYNELETITEKQPAEEDALAQSQKNKVYGKFDIEASHSFSLRNYGKDKSSIQLIESVKDNPDLMGRESSRSNYSRMQAEH